MDFLTFERKATSGQGDFEAWDDHIEWKAYRDRVRDLDARMRAIDDASDIHVTCSSCMFVKNYRSTSHFKKKKDSQRCRGMLVLEYRAQDQSQDTSNA